MNELPPSLVAYGHQPYKAALQQLEGLKSIAKANAHSSDLASTHHDPKSTATRARSSPSQQVGRSPLKTFAADEPTAGGRRAARRKRGPSDQSSEQCRDRPDVEARRQTRAVGHHGSRSADQRARLRSRGQRRGAASGSPTYHAQSSARAPTGRLTSPSASERVRTKKLSTPPQPTRAKAREPPTRHVRILGTGYVPRSRPTSDDVMARRPGRDPDVGRFDERSDG